VLRPAVVAGLLALLLALAPAVARADGDPASDVLITERVFYPYEIKIPRESAAKLAQTITRAREQGYRIRVAIIANEFDLGSAMMLYRRPQIYAKFLAQELALYHSEWVLTVMPNGYGIFHCVPLRRPGGYSDPCERERPNGDDRKLLAALPTQERSKQDWALVAEAAVRTLASAHGVSYRPAWVLPAAGAAAVAFAGGGVLVLARRRRPTARS
jgi:hypothetical protein